MSNLAGVPSDDLADVLATGRTDVTTIFVSMSARHPDGGDAEYLEWHSLDHRPEQSRLSALRGSLRLVSTPECRAVRAVTNERYDRVDHVMSYLFAERAGLKEFGALGTALAAGGRMPLRMPRIELGVYTLDGMVAARRALVAADVIPWRPTRGVFILVEQGAAPAAGLAEIPGVAGVWWYAGVTAGPPASVDTTGMQITYCYLDGEPVEVAKRIGGVVQRRWTDGGVVPLLAAPFHTVVPYEWGRYLP
jgi:hypothetical protein